MMKALIIKQPWVHAILHEGKNIENRSWRPDFRGWLALHASAQPDSYARFPRGHRLPDLTARCLPRPPPPRQAVSQPTWHRLRKHIGQSAVIPARPFHAAVEPFARAERPRRDSQRELLPRCGRSRRATRAGSASVSRAGADLSKPTRCAFCQLNPAR
jgi:hypothetical protein